MAGIGYKITLILFQPGQLHDPKGMGLWKIQNNNLSIHDLRRFYDQNIINYSEDFLDKFLRITPNHDLAVVNGIGLGLVKFLSTPWVIRTTGSDIHYWTNINLSKIRSYEWASDYKKSQEGQVEIKKMDIFAEVSRSAIDNAKGFFSHPPNFFPETERLFNKLEVARKAPIQRIWHQLIIFHFKKFNFQFLQTNQIIFLNGARIDKIDEPSTKLLSLDKKGTKTLLTAIKMLKDDGYHFKVIFFNKGQDLNSVKKYIANNSLESFVTWQDPVSYKKLCYLMQAKRISAIFDSVGDSCIGKIAMMGYLANKPTICNTQENDWKFLFPTLQVNPFLKANSSKTVYYQMKKILDAQVEEKFSHKLSKQTYLKNEAYKLARIESWLNQFC